MSLNPELQPIGMPGSTYGGRRRGSRHAPAAAAVVPVRTWRVSRERGPWAAFRCGSA